VQHVDRGRCSRRPHRSRRHHVRVSQRSCPRPAGFRLGRGDGLLVDAAHRRGRPLRRRDHHRRRCTDPLRHLGYQPGTRRVAGRFRAGPGRGRRPERARNSSARSSTWV
jgi:hypothetical protein